MANDTPDEEQQYLREFAADAKSRPILHKDEQVGPIHIPDLGRVYPGYRGAVPARNAYGFVTFRTRQKDHVSEDEAYLAMDKVLAYLRAKGVQVFLIAEEDTGDVYEFHIRQFTSSPPKRAKPSRARDVDMKWVSSHECWELFADHADHVMIGSREDN